MYPPRRQWGIPFMRLSYRWKGIEVETDFDGIFNKLKYERERINMKGGNENLGIWWYVVVFGFLQPYIL